MSYNIKLGSLRIREVLSELEDKSLNFHSILEEYIAGNIDALAIHKAKNITKNFIAVGGEVRLIEELCSKRYGNHNSEYILKEDFEKLYKEILHKSPNTIAKEYEIPYESADILLPSMMIFKKFLDSTEADRIYNPKVSLIDGVILDVSGKNEITGNNQRFEQDIIDNVSFLAQRYMYNQKHAEDVEAKALKIFDKIKAHHGLGKRERFLLRLSCMLHDIGKFINFSEHYAHSYDIIRASNMLGISKNEQEIIANVARYHSRITPNDENDRFMSIDPHSRLKIAKLSAIIRLADAMDRSHRQKISDFDIESNETEIMIKVNTQQNLLLEKWTFDAKAEYFKEVYGLSPTLKIRRTIGYEGD